MGSEKKCFNCGQWTSNDICEFCGQDLNHKRNHVKKLKATRDKKKLEPSPKLEAFLLKWKNTKNPFLRVGYWIGYSIWTIYMGVITLLAFLAIWGPG